MKHSLRSLRGNPGFTLASLATLALGIGASTVVFTIVNALLLRPLPFGEATSRIVSLHGTHPTQFPDDWDDADVSYADLLDIARECGTLEQAGALVERSFTLYGEDAVRVSGASVTPGLFELLGQEPAFGRNFREGEGARIGFAEVVILSDGLWRSRYGADPGILNRPILVNERELTVVGVMPEGFRHPERADLWVPYDPGEDNDRAARNLFGVARLAPGASLGEARLEVEAAAERLAARYPDTNRGWGIHVLPYRDLVVDDAMRVVSASLLGAVAIVLLIGCANLASLPARARDGARPRARAARCDGGESCAPRGQPPLRRARTRRLRWSSRYARRPLGSRRARRVVSGGLPPTGFDSTSTGAWWASWYFSLATSAAFGLIPALRASRFQLAPMLGSGRDGTASRDAAGIQGGLIVGQVALSLALLVGAALMHQSFANLTAADPGFDGRPILSMRVYLAGDAYDPIPVRTAFFRDAVAAVRAVPGVSSAAITTSIPTDDGGSAARVVTRERPLVDGSEIGVQVVSSTIGLFETLDVPLLEGRTLELADYDDGAAAVAVVNRALAERLWPGEAAAGRENRGRGRGAECVGRGSWGSPPTCSTRSSARRPRNRSSTSSFRIPPCRGAGWPCWCAPRATLGHSPSRCETRFDGSRRGFRSTSCAR